MSIEVFISRLKKVKRSSNNSWMACCPAHDDRTPSLSIKDAGDGRILINCLAGCETLSVLEAVGLDWADVLPEKTITHHAKPELQRIYPSDALKAMQLEARIVMLAAYEILQGEKLTEKDMERLKLAMNRINSAIEAANV